jgi:transketolase
MPDLGIISRKLRLEIVRIAHETDAMHIGSCLSCLDIVISLYYSFLQIDPQKPDEKSRDRFILSKGHASLSLYTVLAEKGFFPKKELSSFNKNGSRLTEHPVKGNLPGIEISSGSLGHGLGIGLGIAKASIITKHGYRCIVLMSDGECNEGSVWEAFLLAPKHVGGILITIIDANGWQATDRTDHIMELNPLPEKLTTFGWSVHEVNGHDIPALISLYEKIPVHGTRPIAIIAHTIKGKGISFMEDDNNWHYRIPSAEDVERARLELEVS